MAEFPALPLWTDAYLGDTMHLDATEHGAYLLLLIVAWRTPDTALPDDDLRLARWARCTPKVWKRVRPILEPFFTVSDGKWVQLRLLEEKHVVIHRRDKAAANGRASALKRKERHKTTRPTERDASDKHEVNGATNGQSTPISISIPNSSEDKSSAAGAASLDVEKAADDYLWSAGKSFLISRGVPKGQAGSIIGKWKGEHGTGKVIEAIGRAQVEPDLVDPIPFINRVLQNSRGRNFTPSGKEYLGV